MDLKAIIRQMAAKGMSEDDIKANLRELGVVDADAVYAKAVEDLKEVKLSPEKKEAEAPSAEAEEGEEPKELFEQEGKAADKAAPAPSEEGELKIEDIVSSDEGKEEKPELMTGVAETSFGNIDAVEKKLDETISLLKALQDINRKILDSERQVLLRLSK